MHKYSTLPPDELENHLSNFLIPHWSVSAVNTFIRNEKAFERYYVFKDFSDTGESIPRVVGTCYHGVLQKFFENWRDFKEKTSMDVLLDIAFRKLDEYELESFRDYTGKTAIEVRDDCQKKINNLVLQFLQEVDVYLKDIQEVIFVEYPITEFIELADVDIPLPIKIIPDLIYINHDGELCGLDHKSKAVYTKDNERHLQFAFQSTGYNKGVSTYLMRDEFAALRKKYPKIIDGMRWFRFYENKYTQNRDKSPQIRVHVVDLKATRDLYESMLFEPVWRIMRAVQDPDYVYLMNPADFFEDGGEIVDFWVKTHLEDLTAFENLNEKQRAILKNRHSKVKRAALSKVPASVVEALKGNKNFVTFDFKNMQDKDPADRIQLILRSFNLNASVKEVVSGYSCDTYLLEVGVGTKIASVQRCNLDIAQALGVEQVRISPDLVKYKDASYLAVEVSNSSEERKFPEMQDSWKGGKNQLPIGLDNFSNVVAWNLDDPSTPHFMLSGASGSGKSYALATMIESALDQGMEVTILDPKNEDKFDPYRSKCKVYTDLEDIEALIEVKVAEMDAIFKQRKKGAAKQVIIFDEVADCLARQTKHRYILVNKYGEVIEKPEHRIEEASNERAAMALREEWEDFTKAKRTKDPAFKTLEENLLILGQKSRSAGIHLVLAAQRFSAKILTGDVKANFTIRLALTAAKGVDSIVMIDEEGAEKLTGHGDGLIVSPHLKGTTRVQCYSR